MGTKTQLLLAAACAATILIDVSAAVWRVDILAGAARGLIVALAVVVGAATYDYRQSQFRFWPSLAVAAIQGLYVAFVLR